jgi:hypothetical protein
MITSNTIEYKGVYCPFRWTIEKELPSLEIFYKAQWIKYIKD